MKEITKRAERVMLLLSGGKGERIGGNTPKQYISVAGKMIIARCLERLLEYGRFDKLVVVADGQWSDAIWKVVEGLFSKDEGLDNSAANGAFFSRFFGFAEPGKNRALSIYNGLRYVSTAVDEDAVIMIHDAVRPLVSDAQLEACFAACREHDGAMPVLPMKDTVYLSRDGVRVSELLPRDQVVAGQAPEAFVLGKYMAAYEALMPDKIFSVNGSTEPAILAGMDVAMIPGDENNFKITTPQDLERYKEICRHEV